MDALEALGHDGLDPGQAHALGGPIAARALAVVLACDDDQGLLALHVGLDGFPHAHDLALGLESGQGALDDLAGLVPHHLVAHPGVGQGGALGGQVVAAVRGVGVEVLLRHIHGGQVFPGGAAGQDGIRRRQVIRGDVVAEDRQGAHAAQLVLTGQGALPVGRPPDVGAFRPPVVERVGPVHGVLDLGEHGVVNGPELLGLDVLRDHRVDLLVAGPQVLEGDRVAVLVVPQHALLDVEADRAGDRIGHHQRRRGQEGLLGVGVDAPVVVAVTGQDGGGVQVPLDDLLLDHRVQGPAHAVAGGAGKTDHAEAQLLELGQQAGVFEVQLHGLGAGRQGALDPGLAQQTRAVGVAGQQAGGHDVARVRGVRAAGDGGDDDGAVGHVSMPVFRRLFHHAGDAGGAQVRGGHLGVGHGRPGQVARDAGQVEGEHALVLGAFQGVGPQPRVFRVGLDQGDVLVAAAREFQVVDGLLVDEEHGRRGAVFRGHVGDGGAVAEGQAACALAEKLQVGAHDLLLAQELGDGQHDVRGGDARLALAGQLDAHDVRHSHVAGAAQHDAFRLQAAHAHSDDAQGVHVRRVAVRAHQRVRVGHPVHGVDHRRHLLQVDLVHDAVARGDHVHVVEGAPGPVDEVEAILVAAVLDFPVLVEGLRIEARGLDRQGVVHDELRRHDGIDRRRVAALLGDGVAQTGEIHQGGLAQDVVAHHARREPGKIAVLAALDDLLQGCLELIRRTAPHQVLGEDPGTVRQPVPGAGAQGLHGLAGVEVVEIGSGERLAVV